MLKCLLVSVLLGGLVFNIQRFSESLLVGVAEAKRRFNRSVEHQPATLQKTIHLKSKQHQIDPIILQIIVQKEVTTAILGLSIGLNQLCTKGSGKLKATVNYRTARFACWQARTAHFIYWEQLEPASATCTFQSSTT